MTHTTQNTSVINWWDNNRRWYGLISKDDGRHILDWEDDSALNDAIVDHTPEFVSIHATAVNYANRNHQPA